MRIHFDAEAKAVKEGKTTLYNSGNKIVYIS